MLFLVWDRVSDRMDDVKTLAFSHNKWDELRGSEEDGRKMNCIEHSQLVPRSVLDLPHQDISSHLTAVETVAA